MRHTATAVALILLAGVSTGCINAGRVNRDCRWTDGSSARLDLRGAQDREHLRQDAQVAWELGQRFADVRYRTRPALARPLLDACRGAMVDSIVARHGVTRDDVDRAMRARVWPIDAITVFVPMAIVTILFTLLAAGESKRMLGPAAESVLARGALVGLVALVMTGLMQIWAMTVETWRLRNEHIAGRGFVLPSVAHPAVALAAMIMLVAATVALRSVRRVK